MDWKRWLILSSLLFGLVWCKGVNKRAFIDSITLKKLPDLVVTESKGRGEGVSAAYGGVLGDAVIVAGGCNFPNVPAAEGGSKVYYDEIYMLRQPESGKSVWEKAGHLPVAAANGASVTVAEGIVCIGGRNTEKALSEVWLLVWNDACSRIEIRMLPALPVALDQPCAATDGKRIFVAGGNADGKPGNRGFLLKGLQAKAWEELPAYPGPARLQPVGAMIDQKFYLLGGFQPVMGEQECRVMTDALCYDPFSRQWKKEGEIRLGEEIYAIIGAAGVSWEDKAVIIQGGVNHSVFKAAVDNPLLQKKAVANRQVQLLNQLKHEQAAYLKHEPEWYQFNRQLLIFEPEFSTWRAVGDYAELAKAGALLVLYRNKLIIVNGECKPGIRSAGVYMIDLGINKNKE